MDSLELQTRLMQSNQWPTSPMLIILEQMIEEQMIEEQMIEDSEKIYDPIDLVAAIA